MATIVASIEYLVHEILLRLPVKSVLRFKCVSKQWLALISDPKFCHSHTLHPYRTSRVFPSAVLFSTLNSPICPIIPLKTKNDSGSSNFRDVKVPTGTVVQSCNGLILIQRNTSENLSEVEYFICNPTTNKSVPVIFPNQKFSSSVISLFICFEPLKSPYYKLVSIRFKNYTSEHDMMNMVIYRSTPDTEYVFNVYSSETSSWIEPGFTFSTPDAEPTFQNNTVFVNGVLYWYIFRLKKFCCFDFETLSFKTFPMPLKIEKSGVLYFGECGGHFIFVLQSRLQIDILEINVESSESSLISNVKEWDTSFFQEMFGPYSVVKENDKDTKIVFFRNGNVMSYNLADSSYEVLMSLNSCLMPTPGCHIYQHFENLSSV
ncbi:hypothetical protein TanjilG_01548 [Lupinus angustifolius]|uniref:F-box protein At5g07610-like n=1 Tax=Lupinus angustifolius TaxID=3871 RepID=UPI00090DD656|nr:PREDICTED: F-box protein At5g07610-like [Lupinus angustifolius]OIV90094.1 hypothetical protein TanjilG_01548 [Lupinus angustifolius]